MMSNYYAACLLTVYVFLQICLKIVRTLQYSFAQHTYLINLSLLQSQLSLLLKLIKESKSFKQRQVYCQAQIVCRLHNVTATSKVYFKDGSATTVLCAVTKIEFNDNSERISRAPFHVKHAQLR